MLSIVNKSRQSESNQQPADYKSAALPVELHQQQGLALTQSDSVWQAKNAPVAKIIGKRALACLPLSRQPHKSDQRIRVRGRFRTRDRIYRVL